MQSSEVHSSDGTDTSQQARDAYLGEPPFDQDEDLDELDKTIADSFPASDPPSH